MTFSETHLQFLRLLERLKNIPWERQFASLKPHEFFALQVVWAHQKAHPEVPGIYVSDFAEGLRCTMPAASKLLKCLEQQGWLRRAVDPKNRRSTFVILTDAGREMLRQELEHSAQQAERIFTRLGEEHTAVLLQSVNEIVDILEEEF